LCTQINFGNQNCIADFTMIDSMGYIFFINNSTLGNNGMYYWDFGDGNYSTQYNPSNIYDSTGTYLVCLTAYDSLQNFCDSTCHYVTITNLISVNENNNPISKLMVAPNPADNNSTIYFTLNQSGDVVFNVYDCFGKMVKEISKQNLQSGKQSIQINTSEFSSG